MYVQRMYSKVDKEEYRTVAMKIKEQREIDKIDRNFDIQCSIEHAQKQSRIR